MWPFISAKEFQPNWLTQKLITKLILSIEANNNSGRHLNARIIASSDQPHFLKVSIFSSQSFLLIHFLAIKAVPKLVIEG
ncbi:hypothetical protein MtrunA17_Chr2g0296201 [Medicago truncatula]|uniref:Uncharacterized protein n=1 Tax=Medicago truncatula TaxID=3880 RepID=A0A396J9T5_MEDTR|nr:hypothetical protein MtrunA17_Chr2g0296201 [Medicago truncatula]